MSVPVGRIVLDGSGRVRAANPAAAELLRCADPTGREWSDVFVPQRAPVGEPLHGGLLPRSRHRFLRLADGAVCGFLLHFAPHESGVVIHFEPASWSLGFVDQLQAAVATTDESGVIVYANGGVAALLGCRADHLVGQKVEAVAEQIGGDPASRDAVLQAALTGKTLLDTFEAVLPGGRRRQLQVHTSEWLYRGLACGVIWSVLDATEAEDASRQAATAVWYRLAATFQHELRNPLQTMQAAIDVLRPLVPGEGARPLSLLEQQVQLVSEYLVEQLQPPTPGVLPPGRLSDVVQGEIERSAVRFSTQLLSFDHQRLADEPLVRLHRGAMSRVFTNLFRNSAAARLNAQVRIRYAVCGDCLVCQVTDDGPGLPAASARGRMIGSPDDLTKHLGLVIVTSTVEAHGGTVTFGNAPDGGAEIQLRLPVGSVVASGAAPGSSLGHAYA